MLATSTPLDSSFFLSYTLKSTLKNRALIRPKIQLLCFYYSKGIEDLAGEIQETLWCSFHLSTRDWPWKGLLLTKTEEKWVKVSQYGED